MQASSDGMGKSCQGMITENTMRTKDLGEDMHVMAIPVGHLCYCVVRARIFRCGGGIMVVLVC